MSSAGDPTYKANEEYLIENERPAIKPTKMRKAATSCSQRMKKIKTTLTRYSVEGDSVWNNFKRNVWCNTTDFVRWFYHKITEPTNVAGIQRKNLRYEFMDLYKNVEEDPLTLSFESKQELQKKDFCTRIFAYFLMEQTWILMLLLGVFSGMMAILLDWSLRSLIQLRNWVEDETERQCGEEGYCKFLRLLSYVIFCTCFSMLAGFIVRFVSPQAAGSGLPEMKSVLSGVVLPRYLTYRTFLAKYLGLIFAMVGGLSVGKEAPFVHISSIIAHQLSKVKFFNRVRKNEALRFQMLAAGCAAGVSCIFGAPIGGVLFSIEVTATYFLVQNLWKSFFCSICGALVIKLGGDRGIFAIFPTYFTQYSFHTWELTLFIIMGVSYGYFGSIFVRVLLKAVHLRRDYKILGETRYYQLIILAIVSAFLFYPFTAVEAGSDDILEGLFGTDPNSMSDWGNNIILKMALFVVIKFFLTVVSLGLPVPCGLYTPVMLMGAVSGRMVGEILALFFESGYITPGGYALVGAAAMSAGATRTLSTAVIVLELTGQLEFLLPVLLATIIATAVGNQFSASAYDTLLEQKRLPYMAPFGRLRMPSDMTTAKDLMRTDVVFLRINADYNDVNELLDKYHLQSYPVVEAESMILRGSITRRALVSLLEARDVLFSNNIEAQLLQNLTQSSTREDTIQRLKNRYKFTQRTFDPRRTQTEDEMRESEEDDDYSIVEEDLASKRALFFNTPISEEFPKLSRSDFDTSPFQVPETAHFYQIHFMFSMLGLNHAFIIRNGNLVGVITKKDFLETTRDQIMWQ